MKRLPKLVLIILLYWLGIHVAQSQNYWDLNHWYFKPLAYHGNTLKKRYIITTPGQMGPNALPVPEIGQGLLDENFYIKIATDAHFSQGDNTQNAFAKLYYPVAAGKIAFELYGVPIEFFKLSQELKTKRRIVDSASTGYTIGDLYFGTMIQIVKDHHIIPDLAVELHCKTASGNNLVLARFTDAPGYFFDISAGKNLTSDKSTFKNTRIYGSGGLYVWHTNSDIHPQDDAFLYGLGFATGFRKWRLNQCLAGYSGYLRVRDRPRVYRFQLSYNQAKIKYGIEYQAGLNDYDYHSFRVSFSYYLLQNFKNNDSEIL